MNLPAIFSPRSWLQPPAKALKGSSDLSGSTLTRRESQEQGIWTTTIQEYIVREVNPRLYEALREAIGPIDAAIIWLIIFDGIIRIEGEDEALVAEIQEWADSVAVNDPNMLRGLQAFYALQGNEMYEQGLSIGQWRYTADGRDIDMLKVADSKGVFFQRPAGVLECWYRRPRQLPQRRDGLANIERVLRNQLVPELGQYLQAQGYAQVDMTRVVYCAFNPENDNPYGVSVMRGMEFVSMALLTLQNSIMRVWARFGDPIFHVNYKTANRKLSKQEVEDRRVKFASDFQQVIEIKRQGNSADFVTAMGADDVLEINVIGGGQTIPLIAEPVGHLMSQITAKTHLPAWLLATDSSAASRMAPKQCELLLQDAKTRWEQRKPGLTALVAAMLRARGRTWNPGDWELVQELPNIADTLANAQAEFYLAQAMLMRANAGGGGLLPNPDDGPVNDGDTEDDAPAKMPGISWLLKGLLRRKARKSRKHVHKKEAFAQDDPELPKLEAKAEVALVSAWRGLQSATLKMLKLDGTKSLKASGDEPSGTYLFDAGQLAELQALEVEFVQGAGGDGSAFAQAVAQALLRGIANGAAEFDTDAVTQAIADRNANAMMERGLAQVKSSAVKGYSDQILKALSSGQFDGQSPDEVSTALAQLFDAGEYNWRRLARTEIANAQFNGKLDQYSAQGVSQFEWIAAPDACPVCQDLAEAGPYSVEGGPSPEDDSHPECRCTVEAVIAGE